MQKKCLYEEGYVYQPVFSCQTCYEEMAKQTGKESVLVGKIDETERQLAVAEVVEPHGFCVACMLHCHEGHDVYELYSKLDFRCDCGNSRMPFSCHIDGSMGPCSSEPEASKKESPVPVLATGNICRDPSAKPIQLQAEFQAAEGAGKSHKNEENVYNLTFFDIYCICRKPHNA